MKTILSFLVIAFMLGVVSPVAFGQVSKEEKKFWKQKAKMYKKEPLTLKAEFENYQEQVQDLKKRNQELMAQAASPQKIDSLQWAISQLQSELSSEKAQRAKLEAALANQPAAPAENTSGLIYRVQIGAYVFYEMGDTPPNSDDFRAEKADGFNKYVIGAFRDYNRASSFKDELRKMGMKDAFIVPYIDNRRVTIDEARAFEQNGGS